eukprot:scaffold3.g6672.t1
MDAVRARWVEVTSYQNPPSPRCGHVAVSVDSRDCWQQEFLIVHGGIDASKEALDDLHVLQCEQEAWFSPEPAAVGPAARAFHAAAVIGRRVYIFGGHVFIKAQHKLHHFHDLWCLNTDSWEWSRLDFSPEAPHPSPRDRASMAVVGDSKLLVYGGADSTNKRLDDAWVFDLQAGTWSELRPAGPRPRPRCCTALFPLERRVLLFGGDSYGVNGELWSLRGVQDGDGPPAWTQLHLEGPAPAPRRGHAVAGGPISCLRPSRRELCFAHRCSRPPPSPHSPSSPLPLLPRPWPAPAAGSGSWVVYCGGLSEQKSMLGIKSKPEYLSDVCILDRRVDKVTWHAVDVASAQPTAREKHTLTALAGGRLLLFGGTDGQTTLGDAWWLDLEDVAVSPRLISREELPPSSGSRNQAPAATAATGAYGGAPAARGGAPPGPAAGGGGPAAAAAADAGGGALGGSLAYLSTALPAMPSGLTSALSSLRDRLGLPPSASAGALAAAQQAAAAGADVEAHDQALLHLGERVLAADSSGGGGGGGAAPAPAALAAAARAYLAGCRAEDLRLGEVHALMEDYRRLARVGWALVLQERGAAALLDPATHVPGRFMHLQAGDLRVRECAAVLDDYRQLVLAQQQQQQQQARQAAGGPGAGS